MEMFATKTLAKVIKPGKFGTARIDFIHVGKLESIMSAVSGSGVGYVYPGKYLRLCIEGHGVVMSNTRMEQKSNWEIVNKAHGKVLIAGLGMGMILVPILKKQEVTSVTVIEKNPDVIRLMKRRLRHKKLNVIHADINEWCPLADDKYNVIYFDIWPNVDTTNLHEIANLHNRFKGYVDRTDTECWMSSWMVDHLRSEKRKESKGVW